MIALDLDLMVLCAGGSDSASYGDFGAGGASFDWGAEGDWGAAGDWGDSWSDPPAYDPPTWTEADVDTTGVEPFAMSPQEQYAQTIDLLQNYQDGASPPQLYQNPDLTNCEVVATLNGIALTPQGQEFLESLVKPNGDGTYQVSLVDKSGQPQTVNVTPGEAMLSTGGNHSMQLIEAALMQAAGQTTGNQIGLPPGDAMVRLGLQGVVTVDGGLSAAISYDQGGPVVGVAGLYQGNVGHAYTVVGAVTDPSTGALSLVLQDPYGFGHPTPYQESALNTAVGDSTTGTVPGFAPGGAVP